MKWQYSYLYWYWNQKGDPMAGGFKRMQEYGENGWELVGLVSLDYIQTKVGDTQTAGTTIVATFKGPKPG